MTTKAPPEPPAGLNFHPTTSSPIMTPPSSPDTAGNTWIWEGARSLWQSGHFAEAVAAATRKLNAETQNRVGTRELSETQLFNDAFSDNNPADGHPRLRLAEDDDGKTAKSVRRGIRAFADGCFSAIRNPLAHENSEFTETEALERLAALSVLARWVAAAKVYHH